MKRAIAIAAAASATVAGAALLSVNTATAFTRRIRRLTVLLLVVGTVVGTTLAGTTTPASAHKAKGLNATILSNSVSCASPTSQICAVDGRVRVRNNRAAGSGKIVICVGIDVHTANHRSLSLEPPLPGGQGITSVRPGRSRVAEYRTIFDRAAGVAHHVHVTHVHKSIAQGGQQC